MKSETEKAIEKVKHYYFTSGEFFIPEVTDCFYRCLNDSKSPRLFRILLSTLISAVDDFSLQKQLLI